MSLSPEIAGNRRHKTEAEIAQQVVRIAGKLIKRGEALIAPSGSHYASNPLEVRGGPREKNRYLQSFYSADEKLTTRNMITHDTYSPFAPGAVIVEVKHYEDDPGGRSTKFMVLTSPGNEPTVEYGLRAEPRTLIQDTAKTFRQSHAVLIEDEKAHDNKQVG
jgi:hypothetical protein